MNEAKRKEKEEKAAFKVPLSPCITVQIGGVDVNQEEGQSQFANSYAHVPVSRIAAVAYKSVNYF